jgi:dipeptidyl aminopeptidase/acylaminoacyl peptidase
MQTVDALVRVARTLPDVRAEQIGLFGHSRGGVAALNYLLERGSLQAVVLNSAGYPPKLADLVSRINAPILMLHGTADSREDGGGAVSNIQMARDFEAKVRAAGKSVEAVYYEGGRHNDIFTSAKQYRDEVQRMLSFFRDHLRT